MVRWVGCGVGECLLWFGCLIHPVHVAHWHAFHVKVSWILKNNNKFLTDTEQFWLFQLFEAGLASFVAGQQPGALADVYLPLGDKGKDVNMLIPLAFIVGDNQGGGGIIGRAAVYNETARHIFHSCNATIAQYTIIESDCCPSLAFMNPFGF